MEETLTVKLAGGSEAPARARAAITSLDESLEGLGDVVRLLATELITNSVRHARAGSDALIELALRCSPRRVRVEVVDSGPGFEPREPQPGPEGGFGLLLVEQLSDRWGVRDNGHVRVWAEIDRS